MRTVSILIPTHNRSKSLVRVLESLVHLRFPNQVEAEVIVVANACTDDTEAAVAAAAPTMPMSTRCVVEVVPGLSTARNRAAMEARGDILAFLDDDVWVHPDWLIGLCEVYDQKPADIVGGRVLLWWEAVARPPWMSGVFETMLSAFDRGENVHELAATGNIGIVGANFSFSRQAFTKLKGFRAGLGRNGKSLLGGEETEFLLRGRSAGFRLFYAPRASVKHWVAPHRIDNGYLHQLAFDYGRTGVFMTQSRPIWRWWPTIVGQPMRALVSFAGELPARVTGNETSALSRRLGAIERIGRSVGALQLLCGRSPLNGSQ
jgi:glucosyl-dolichyl phosphate glucuronosyltransferase